MDKNVCGHIAEFGSGENFYECAVCGNHICRKQAKTLKGVCPHCFGKLFRIS